MPDLLRTLTSLMQLPDALTLSHLQAQAAKRQDMQDQQVMSARSQLAGGPGGFDPLSANHGYANNGQPIFWNAPTPPSDNVTVVNAQQDAPTLWNASGSTKNDDGSVTVPRTSLMELEKSSPSSLPPGLMSDLPTLQSWIQQQRQTAARAYPDAAGARIAATYFPQPIGKLAAGESFVGPIDPTTGKAQIAVTAPAMPPDSLRTVAGLQQMIQQLGPGTPAAAPYEALMKSTLGFQTDPNKIAETQASTADKVASAAKNTVETGQMRQGMLDDGTVDFMAEQMLAGAPLQTLGRGTQGSVNIARVFNRYQQMATAAGINGQQQAAAIARYKANSSALETAATRGAQMDMTSQEVDSLANQALQASQVVSRTNYVPINQLANYARSQSSNPAYGQLDVAIQGLKTAYSQALARTGVTTDSARAHADALFDDARSHADLQARIAQAQQETKAVLASTSGVQSNISNRIAGGGRAGQSASPQIRVYNPSTGKLE